MAYEACGTMTTVEHDETQFIVFCDGRRGHPGGHTAILTWEEDEDRKDETESDSGNDGILRHLRR